MKTNIAIIDYSINNVFSISKALASIGHYPKIVNKVKNLSNYKFIIIPGVGSFDPGLKMLKNNGFLDELEKIKFNDHYFLGICLGMQLLFNTSEESLEKKKGISAISGNCKKIPKIEKIKIPHIGWNTVKKIKNSELTQNLENNFDAYFVHSYYADVSNKENIIATTAHGIEFPVIVNNKNFYGVQFHPEKCKKHGIKILENFVKIK